MIFTVDCFSLRIGWPFIICAVVFVEGLAVLLMQCL